MRGLLCDTSVVDSDQAWSSRGIPIGNLCRAVAGGDILPLCTGDLPDAEELASLQSDFASARVCPFYVWRVLEALPEDSHPMTLFSTAVLAMERESVFRRRYAEGMPKDEYWQATLEDCLQLLAVLPGGGCGNLPPAHPPGN